eukprot:6034129-Amphidinium_carterae.1
MALFKDGVLERCCYPMMSFSTLAQIAFGHITSLTALSHTMWTSGCHKQNQTRACLESAKNS